MPGGANLQSGKWLSGLSGGEGLGGRPNVKKQTVIAAAYSPN